MLNSFIKAVMIGFAIAAPVGPIGILCIRKTLESGLKGAILVGLGASIALSIYGLIAGLGMSAITNILIEKEGVIKVVGGLLLLYLAYRECNTKPSNKEASVKAKSDLQTILAVTFLTLTSPMTIISFIGIFASINTGAIAILDVIIMVLGIFVGSMCWWFILGGVISKIKHKLPEIWLSRIKYIAAIILAGFGLYSLLQGLKLF
ncbi:MAG: LysE family transporter [Alphaproteobacteria bacterium]|mgnify:CR=1 FL=1|nr:LysE family transporter [Alphaproteobacteria bacterium]OJV17240.1 MAG: hypothetical protein BGO27_06155 [Alphaproteobacteria bacterium 33-17]